MTDRELNIALVEAVGWKPDEANVGRRHEKVKGWWHEGRFFLEKSIPDCCNDLNVCHQLEEQLPGGWSAYQRELKRITNGQFTEHATARQRAESLLRIFTEKR